MGRSLGCLASNLPQSTLYLLLGSFQDSFLGLLLFPSDLTSSVVAVLLLALMLALLALVPPLVVPPFLEEPELTMATVVTNVSLWV